MGVVGFYVVYDGEFDEFVFVVGVGVDVVGGEYLGDLVVLWCLCCYYCCEWVEVVVCVY